jgi:glucokinase
LADIYAAIEPLTGEPVAGLGVGFPSFGDYSQGILESELSSYPSMDGFPLRQHLEDRYGVPTKMVADGNLFAHGIRWFGEGRRFASFVAIALGTGTAIGLVKDGEVLTGPQGFPEPSMRFYTEWGWPAAWGHSGYHFAEHYGSDPESMSRRANAGDLTALNVFEQVGAALAKTISRLAGETGMQFVVIGGGLANAWTFIAPSVRDQTNRRGISVIRTGLAYPSLVGAAALFEV